MFFGVVRRGSLSLLDLAGTRALPNASWVSSIHCFSKPRCRSISSASDASAIRLLVSPGSASTSKNCSRFSPRPKSTYLFLDEPVVYPQILAPLQIAPLSVLCRESLDRRRQLVGVAQVRTRRRQLRRVVGQHLPERLALRVFANVVRIEHRDGEQERPVARLSEKLDRGVGRVRVDSEALAFLGQVGSEAGCGPTGRRASAWPSAPGSRSCRRGRKSKRRSCRPARPPPPTPFQCARTRRRGFRSFRSELVELAYILVDVGDHPKKAGHIARLSTVGLAVLVGHK